MMKQANLTRQAQPDDEVSTLELAVGASIALHVVVFYLYPYMNTMSVIQPPQRIEVELDTRILPPAIQAAPEPEPPPPKGEQTENPDPPKQVEKAVKKSQPKSVEPPPVLAVQTPAPENDYTVAPQPAPAQTISPVQTEADGKETERIAAYGKPEGKESSQGDIASQSEVASSDEAWDGYGQQLYDHVSRNKNYPAIAIRRSLEGEVKIVAKFNKGELISVSIMDASGHKPLDDEALRMVKKAIAELAVKGSLAKKSFTVTVPVLFKLDQG